MPVLMAAPVAAAAGPGGALLSGLGTSIGGLLSGAGAATGPAISGGNPLFNDRNFINIAPVGVNLGEMLRNFEGPPENGGFGLETSSRMSPTIGASFDLLGSKAGFSTGLLPILLLIGGAVIVGVVLNR